MCFDLKSDHNPDTKVVLTLPNKHRHLSRQPNKNPCQYEEVNVLEQTDHEFYRDHH